MNKEIAIQEGFTRELSAVEAGACPICGQVIKTVPFRNEASVKEYKISGMCQECQDDFFGLEEG